MLSRTADSLYWTGRFVERADYLARILDAATRLAALPGSGEGPGNPWESALLSSGVAEAFAMGHDQVDERSTREFLAFDTANPSSISAPSSSPEPTRSASFPVASPASRSRKARWWSTPARAVAPRIPGCSTHESRPSFLRRPRPG